MTSEKKFTIRLFGFNLLALALSIFALSSTLAVASGVFIPPRPVAKPKLEAEKEKCPDGKDCEKGKTQ